MTLQAQIKQHLETFGIKQVWLQNQLNINRSVCSALLNGKRRMTADEYISICKALNLPLNHFTTDIAATMKSE